MYTIELNTEHQSHRERYLGSFIKRTSLKPIDRDRAKARAAKVRMRLAVRKFLKALSPRVAQALADDLGLQKRETLDVSARARAAVASLDFSELGAAVIIALIPELAPIFEAIVRDGAQQALQQLGLGRPEVEQVLIERAQEWAEYRAAEMVGMKYEGDVLVPNPDAQWQITEGTREYLRADVEAALTEGWSTQELANILQDSYAFSGDRADTIARTEIAKADNEGAMIGYRASGVVAGKRWLTAEDDKVSPKCRECEDAGAIGLNDTFPSGADAPPNHPNCRCVVLPVLDDEMQPND